MPHWLASNLTFVWSCKLFLIILNEQALFPFSRRVRLKCESPSTYTYKSIPPSTQCVRESSAFRNFLFPSPNSKACTRLIINIIILHSKLTKRPVKCFVKDTIEICVKRNFVNASTCWHLHQRIDRCSACISRCTGRKKKL